MGKAVKYVSDFAIAGGMIGATLLFPALEDSPLWDKLMVGAVLSGIGAAIGDLATDLAGSPGTSITTRQSNAFRTIVYGERQIPGNLVYSSTTANDHRTYNQAIALCGHEVEAILSAYLDGRRVFFIEGSTANVTYNGVNFGGTADGNNHTGPDGLQYNFGGFSDGGKVYISPHFGVDGDTALDGGFNANDPNWAANSHGTPYLGGIAWVYLKLRYDAGIFPQRPETRFVVRGYNKIYDPRTGTYGYTNNLALCLADVLLNTTWGLGYALDEIDMDALIAAANLADEDVELAAGGTEKRYTCNYTCDTSTAPGDMLQAMLAAGAGYITWANGLWTIQLGAYVAPTVSLTKADIKGPIVLNPAKSYRDICNRIRGQYIAPFYPYSATDATGSNLYDSNGYWDGSAANTFNLAWMATSYPFYAQDVGHGYASDQWQAEDGKIIYKDLNHAACISLATVQRLAKIELLRNRLQSISGTLRLGLGAYRLRGGDTFMLTVPELGWAAKVFEVVTPRFTPGYIDDDGTAVPYKYEIDFRETSPLIYQWNEATEEQTIYAVPANGGGIPSIIDPPTALTLSHQTISFGGLGSASGDGIYLSWTPSDDGYVTSTVIQYSSDGGTTWFSAGTVPQGNFQAGIAPLPGGSYTVQVAAQRANGSMSAWTSATISF